MSPAFLVIFAIVQFVVAFAVYHLPCHHGKDCRMCAEAKREQAIRDEAKAEKDRQNAEEFARKHAIALRCEKCHDWHVPHE